MSSNGHDIQVCVCKSLKLLWNMCVTFVLEHPIWSFSMLCSFLLYIVFPLVFWVLLYSLPLVVCTSIILSFPLNPKSRTETNDTENRQLPAQAPHESTKGNPFTRVHSVRRRRAKEFARDSEDEAVIDKNALVTEDDNNNYIREVELVQDYSSVNSTKSSSCSASQSPKHVFDESQYQSLDDGNGKNDNKAAAAAPQGNEDEDGQKNKMDCVGISDSERTKRLESLIARRRSRKMLSLEVRRTLMNKDKNDHGQIPPFFFPKSNHNAPGRLVIPRNGGPGGGNLHSPSPGSAPSILVPMRNPFDLPYDPQEEKPDLTGDGFAREFMPPVPTRDGMFCRHESFSLGPTFLRPGEYNHRSKKQMSLDSRFRTRASPSFSSSTTFHQFARKEFDRKFAPVLKEDHVKEIVEDDDDDDDGDIDDEEDDEVQTRATREDASWCSPTSSEEDEAPVFKIDREAILKSLSSMARRNAPQQDEEHSSGRLYYSDRRHRATSFSIASDLQVEVSERSSPPMTIDENLSYPDYDDDDEADSWGNLDLSQVGDYESGFLVQVPEDDDRAPPLSEPICAHPWCSIAEFPDSCHTTRATNLDEKIDKTLQRSASSLAAHTPKRNDEELKNTLDAVHENNTNESLLEPEQRDEVITGSSSSSSVVDEQTQRSAEPNVSAPRGALLPNVDFDPAQSSPSPKSVLQTTCSVASFDHYVDDESPAPHRGSRASRDPEPRLLDEEPSEPSNTLTTQTEEVSGINNSTAISETTSHSNDSSSPTLTKEELSKREEIAIGKTTQDKGHEKPGDEESSTSYCFDATKDEVITSETPVFEVSGEPLMEDNVNSESKKKNEEDRNVHM